MNILNEVGLVLALSTRCNRWQRNSSSRSRQRPLFFSPFPPEYIQTHIELDSIYPSVSAVWRQIAQSSGLIARSCRAPFDLFGAHLWPSLGIAIDLGIGFGFGLGIFGLPLNSLIKRQRCKKKHTQWNKKQNKQ